MKSNFVLIGFVVILLASMIVVPSSADWNNNLNNQDIPLYYLGSTAHQYPYMYPYSDTFCAYASDFNYLGGFYLFPNGSGASTYFAFNNMDPTSRSGATGYYLQSDALALYGPYLGATTGRIEIVKVSPISAKMYQDGVLVATTAIPSIDTTSFAAGVRVYSLSGSTAYIDDPAYGNGAWNTALVSVQPHNWYLLYDFLNPANYGQKDENDNTVSTTSMHIQWSIGAQADGWDITSPPNTRYSIRVQTPTGNIAYLDYVNITASGHAYGIVTLPFNQTYIGNVPKEYGAYFVTLFDGSYVKSQDYFIVSATGAVISWDATRYTESDTGIVSYDIDGSYWITSTYDYKVEVKNIYGETMFTQAISSQTGDVSVVLTGYDPGVYYAELIAVDKVLTTSEGVLGISPMEITEYAIFNGYVMNAETGATISGANISITQSLSSGYANSDSDGWYINADEQWLSGDTTTITATKSGYNNSVASPILISAKNVTVNLSMMPYPPTYSGVSIGGVVTDRAYHNPIPGATYYVMNSANISEVYSSVTNIAGYARIDNLVNGTEYDVWSEKSGFLNSAITKIVAVGEP